MRRYESPRCVVCGGGGTEPYTAANGCAIVRCLACGLLYAHPMPDIRGIYTDDYFSGAAAGHGYVNYDEDKRVMLPTMREYVRRLRALLPAGGSLLDVGAATGFFMTVAKEAGFDVHGVEIADYAAAQGRAKGLDIMTGTLETVTGEGRFDAITMLDVIEHVGDPRWSLERVWDLLKSGGIVLINTPDAGSAYARFMGKRWHLIVPPEHLFYFDRANLSRLLADTGFEIRTVTTIGKRFTLPYIFQTLYRWQGLSFWRALARLSEGSLAKLAIPINTGDNMVIIARKP